MIYYYLDNYSIQLTTYEIIPTRYLMQDKRFLSKHKSNGCYTASDKQKKR